MEASAATHGHFTHLVIIHPFKPGKPIYPAVILAAMLKYGTGTYNQDKGQQITHRYKGYRGS